MGTNVKLYVFLLHPADDPVSFIYLLFVAVLRRLTLAYPRVAVIICSVYAFTSVRALDYSLTEALCCVPPVLNLRVVFFAREVPDFQKLIGDGAAHLRLVAASGIVRCRHFN